MAVDVAYAGTDIAMVNSVSVRRSDSHDYRGHSDLLFSTTSGAECVNLSSAAPPAHDCCACDSVHHVILPK